MSHALNPYHWIGPAGASRLLREQSGVMHEYWSLRENAEDRRGHLGQANLEEYDTTQVGGIYTGKFRSCARFNSAGAKLVLKTATTAEDWWASGTTPWAFALWLRPQLAATFQVVMSKSDTNFTAGVASWRLNYQDVSGSDKFFVQSNTASVQADGQAVSTVACSTNTWYHVVWGYDGANLFVSVNNETLVTDATSTIDAGSAKFALGGTETTSAGGFTGEACEMFYRRGGIFDSDERAALYNAGAGCFLVVP